MDVEGFIARWSGREGGAERANYALFLSELCQVLNLPPPDPAGASSEKNDYVFERFIRRPDASTGRIDLYKRDCFVLEAKQSRQTRQNLLGELNDKYVEPSPSQPDLLRGLGEEPVRGRRSAARGWDVLMLNARQQAEDYARHLPQDHGWPPFVIVCDVGHSLEVFADFRRMGKYEQFPDRQSFRIYLEDLRDEKVRERLRAIWLDPQGLDPTRRAAAATRLIAARLAAVSKSLEARDCRPEDVAHFLMRCIFTMFAEDWTLLPADSFTGLLERSEKDPGNFPRRVKELWAAMDTGGFSHTIDAQVRHFNGGLFAQTTAFELGKEEIGELLAAARADWREVEPAIFGTLLEQALDPKERKKLGAHYTPRAYVERLVNATVIDPLRDDWRTVLAAAEERRAAGDLPAAAGLVRDFHEKLCATRVLDPACGTGNFLYVSLELMKRLEGEVLEALSDLGGQEALGLSGHTVDPHQFLGLELNPRAAAIAELVLWIGYLQQHFRLKGAPPGDPVLRAFGNINFGRPGGFDAVLTWDGYPLPQVVHENGAARETYPNPRQPEWPQAEFIVGNPPFIGGKDLRARLGGGYAEALWKAHKSINASADFVMYWWDHAAELLTRKATLLRRFGFVTTNSITQEFSRRVIRARLEAKTPISFIYAVPDHPWTKAAADSAAVRIAMTVSAQGKMRGLLGEVKSESDLDSDAPVVVFVDKIGLINSDLTLGSDTSGAIPLIANNFLSSRGMMLFGLGFLVSADTAENLGLGSRKGLDQYIRPYMNGRDFAGLNRDLLAIDLYGLAPNAIRSLYPEVYQHVLSNVKPEKDANRDPDIRGRWWEFGRPRIEIRPALVDLKRYVVTAETMRHRIFAFQAANVVSDNKLVCFAVEDAWILGTLSSAVHVCWAVRLGGWLGVGNDSVYSKSRVFDPFPFPDPDHALKAQLRRAGEELDAFRKARQAEHPRLTLTQMYNVREAIRAGRALTPDEERIKDEGLVLILNELHDEIDRLTLQAYGWPEGLSDEEIIARLVALNAERAAEERRGLVRWLRPDYQKARAGVVELKRETAELDLAAAAAPGKAAAKPLFPQGGVDQMAAVTAALLASPAPLDAAALAAGFRQGRKVEAKITALLQALARTGAAATRDGGKTFQLRKAA